VVVAGDEINACMVNSGALKTIFGEPIEQQAFAEIPDDFGVSRAFCDVHTYVFLFLGNGVRARGGSFRFG
jgi:hypothetical protein